MKKTVAVIGGNQCALAFAYFAAKNGFSVSVYEQKDENQVAYDWTDDLASSVFFDVGLPFPPESFSHKTHCVAFVSPDKSTEIYVDQPEDERDTAVSRRPFNRWLCTLAKEAGAEVFYNKKAVSLNIDGDRITGVNFDNGETVTADFTVDCCGVNSVLRISLPEKFGITNNIDKNDTFFVIRKIFKRIDGVPAPKNPKRLYLKHLGEIGISWSVLCRGYDAADVLVGRIGGLETDTFEKSLNDLKKDNPHIGTEVLAGDDNILQIPIRHPVTKLFADGYALLGDSACMTIPLIGSGMASGIRAAKMLADCISNSCENPFCSENLYGYQHRFMKEIGVGFSAIEVVKNSLLPADVSVVNSLINSGILAAVASSSEDGKGGLLKSVGKMIAHERKLTAMLIGVGLKALRAMRVCSSMPKKYEPEKLKKWQSKYEKAFK